MILGNGQDRTVGGKIALDGLPSFPGILGSQKIRSKIGVFVIIEGCVNFSGFLLGGKESADIRPLRDTGELVNLLPGSPAVLRYLDQAIIRTNVEQSLFLGRFCQGDDVAVQ